MTAGMFIFLLLWIAACSPEEKSTGILAGVRVQPVQKTEDK